MNSNHRSLSIRMLVLVLAGFIFAACTQEQEKTAPEPAPAEPAALELSDDEVENIVRRTYQYVAMYNVNNKGAFDPANPMSTGSLNVIKANTTLTDHTMQAIARPNNDTLYTFGLLDLRDEPIVVEMPAFDSRYVSLMVTGYDHYVNVPMSTRLGDFAKPSRIMFYTERTKSYDGAPVEGVDKALEMTGDFVSAVFRVMPHASEPERMARNLAAKQAIRAMTLSEFQTGVAPDPAALPDFPDYGASDFDIYENNLLAVMQFVVNHTTFEDDDEVDVELLAALEPLGVVPGQQYDATKVAQIDGARFRAVAERIAPATLAQAADPKFLSANVTRLFQPKGQIPMELLLFQSVIGPIGQPALEAVYPAIGTADGQPMNAMHDYVMRMSADEMPPATAFWSATLYDSANGFFMPNDRKKYSVGENAGMAVNDDGGITIYIAAEQPEGVPEENWLPVARGDYGMDIIMRLYAPDLEKFATWTPPVVERLE